MKNFQYLLVAMFAAGTLTACGQKEETPVVESPIVDETPVVEELPLDEMVDGEEEYVEPEFNIEDVQVNVTGTLADAYLAVREAYGNDYLPGVEIPAEFLQEIYGVNPEHVAQVVAEQPMMSFHPDLFIGVEATEGNADAVEAALKAYHEQLLADTMQYPSNLAKIAASQVVRYDNYIFFVLLGAPNPNMDATEEEATEFAKTEMEKGLTALNSVFNK